MQGRYRLRDSRDFRRVSRSGTSVACPEFVLYYSARAGEGGPRFGFVVGRRIGGAVVRNRVKRLLREAARPLLPRLRAPVDVVIVAREPIRNLAYAELREALEESTARAGLLTESRDRSTST